MKNYIFFTVAFASCSVICMDIELHPYNIKELNIEKISQSISAQYTHPLFPEALTVYTLTTPDDCAAVLKAVKNCSFNERDINKLMIKNPYFKKFITIHANNATYFFNHLNDHHLPLLDNINDYAIPTTMSEQLRNYILKKVHAPILFHYRAHLPHNACIKDWDLCTEQKKFVSVTMDNMVLLWDLTTGECEAITHAQHNIQKVKLSNNGEYTFTYFKKESDQSGILQKWNNKIKQCVTEWDNGPCYLNFLMLGQEEVVAIGTNPHDFFSSQYCFMLVDKNPVVTVSQVTQPLAITYQNAYEDYSTPAYVQIIHTDDKDTACVPQRSLSLFYLSKIINNTHSKTALDEIPKTKTFQELYPLEKKLIKNLMDRKTKRFDLNTKIAHQNTALGTYLTRPEVARIKF